MGGGDGRELVGGKCVQQVEKESKWPGDLYLFMQQLSGVLCSLVQFPVLWCKPPPSHKGREGQCKWYDLLKCLQVA